MTPGPAVFNACDYLLDRHIRAGRGDRLALTGPAGDLTYAELHDRVRRVYMAPQRDARVAFALDMGAAQDRLEVA